MYTLHVQVCKLQVFYVSQNQLFWTFLLILRNMFPLHGNALHFSQYFNIRATSISQKNPVLNLIKCFVTRTSAEEIALGNKKMQRSVCYEFLAKIQYKCKIVPLWFERNCTSGI